MSNFIPLPPTYAIVDPQARAVLDVLTRNMQVVIDSGTITPTNTALTSVGGASTFGSANVSNNITNLAPAYTLDTLTADLKRGAAEVITGITNGTTVMKLEPAGQYVVFQHKDAVILGTTGTYAGTIRTGLGITSTGIIGGYNRTSDGAWQTTFAIESSTGNLTLLGTIRAASIISADAYLGATLVSDVVSNAASVTTKLNKSAADILSGGITFSSAGGFKTGTIAIDGSGNVTGAGVAFTSQGIVGRNAGATTFTIDATTGAATFKGDITGGSNINITGTGIFNGASSSGGYTFAVVANAGTAAQGGIISYSSNAFTGAVMGYATGAAFGGYFDSSGTQAALACSRSGSGAALQVNGPMTMFNSTVVTNLNADLLDGNHASAFYVTGGALGTPSSGNLTNCTFPTLNQNTTGNAATATYATSSGSASFASSAGSATYSDYLGGYIASDWARIFPTNSGVANAGGSGVNLLGSTSTGIAGAYVGTSGSGNIVTWTVQTTSPSDIRLKEEIANSDLGLAFVKQLRPVSYKLKADPKHQKGYGFIAQEVESLIGEESSLVYHEPDWKVGDETGFKTIHYPSYIAVLTKAIQELSAKVEILEAK